MKALAVLFFLEVIQNYVIVQLHLIVLLNIITEKLCIKLERESFQGWGTSASLQMSQEAAGEAGAGAQEPASEPSSTMHPLGREEACTLPGQSTWE